MMIRYLRIFGLILLYFLSTAKSCNDREMTGPGGEEAALNARIDSIRTASGADWLSEGSLRAMEENAKLKLADFADYFRITADASLDTSFRSQASEMMRDLFYPVDVHFKFSLPAFKGKREFDLQGLLHWASDPDWANSAIFFDSVQVIEPLHRQGPTGYSGILGCIQGYRKYSGKDTIVVKPEEKKVDFFVLKTGKQFGKDTLVIWRLFLANIY